MRIPLLVVGLSGLLGWGCEEQVAPRTAESAPAVPKQAADEEVDTEALRKPGSADYFRAVAGAKGTAERLKDKIDDYNRQVEDQADDVFND